MLLCDDRASVVQLQDRAVLPVVQVTWASVVLRSCHLACVPCWVLCHTHLTVLLLVGVYAMWLDFPVADERLLLATCIYVVSFCCSAGWAFYISWSKCCLYGCACEDVLTLLVLHFFWLWQKWVYQSVQHHTGLTHPFKIFFWHSGTLELSPERHSARMSKN